MSNLYTPVLVVHVLVAVLGLGSVASVALVAATARKAGRGVTDVSPWLGPLLRYSAVCLGVMFITGILLDLAADGAFRGAWWFRGSALLLLATGALHGLTRRSLRSGGVQRVERFAYGMCALLGAITVLMEVKPFR